MSDAFGAGFGAGRGAEGLRWGRGKGGRGSESTPNSSPLSTPSSSNENASLLGQAVTKKLDAASTSSSGSGGSTRSSGSGGSARLRAAPAAEPTGPLVGGLEKTEFAKKTRKVDRDAALLALAVLDASPDESLNHFVNQVVQPRFNTSMVALSMLDNDRQFFANKFGLGCRETPIDQAFCAHAVQEDDVFVVLDARHDVRFSTNPLVTGDPFIRFYAGAPLVWEDGSKLGTLCILENRTRTEFTKADRMTLKMFAVVAVNLLAGRRDKNRLIMQSSSDGWRSKQLVTAATSTGGIGGGSLGARPGARPRLSRRLSQPVASSVNFAASTGSAGAAVLDVEMAAAAAGGTAAAGGGGGVASGRAGAASGTRGRTRESKPRNRKRSRSLAPADCRSAGASGGGGHGSLSRGTDKIDIPQAFLRNFRKKFVLMEEKLQRILRRLKATEQSDTHLKLVTEKLTVLVTAVVEGSHNQTLQRVQIQDVVTELGELLGLAPNLFIAELIREILIVLVEPARQLECLEYMPNEFMSFGGTSEKLQNLLTIYPPEHSLHVCRVIARYFGCDAVKQAQSVDPSQFWRAGRISARTAEEMLAKRVSGTFLIRDSESTLGAQSLTVRAGDRIYHFRINTLPDSQVALKVGFSFPTIVDLVEFHREEQEIGGVMVALGIGYKNLNSHPWYHGSISAAQTETKLMQPKNKEGAFLVREGSPNAIREADDSGLMVSFRAKEGVVEYGIKIHPKGGYTMAGGPAFDTPEKLIIFYSGEKSGSQTTNLRRALTRTRSRRKTLNAQANAPRPKDLGYVLVGTGGAGIAVAYVDADAAGAGFGQIGYYQRHWMKQKSGSSSGSEGEGAAN